MLFVFLVCFVAGSLDNQDNVTILSPHNVMRERIEDTMVLFNISSMK